MLVYDTWNKKYMPFGTLKTIASREFLLALCVSGEALISKPHLFRNRRNRGRL